MKNPFICTSPLQQPHGPLLNPLNQLSGLNVARLYATWRPVNSRNSIMSHQAICPRQPTYSPDARKAALETVLRGGLNKVIWDDCRLIWDSRSILGDIPNSEEQMAVFGVKGKVETPEYQHVDFQIRYTVRFEAEPIYLIHAAVDGTMDSANSDTNELEVVQSELPDGVNRRELFNEAVRSLTSKVVSIGHEATIKSFLSPEDNVDRGSH